LVIGISVTAGQEQGLECWKRTRTGGLEKNKNWRAGVVEFLNNKECMQKNI
jgi:hypothetical protein